MGSYVHNFSLLSFPFSLWCVLCSLSGPQTDYELMSESLKISLFPPAPPSLLSFLSSPSFLSPFPSLLCSPPSPPPQHTPPLFPPPFKSPPSPPPPPPPFFFKVA